MSKPYDVVFHTHEGHVRCGPFLSLDLAQDFIMSVDSDAFSYNVTEIVHHGDPVKKFDVTFRPASA